MTESPLRNGPFLAVPFYEQTVRSKGAEDRKVQHFLVIAAAKDRWLHSMAFLVVECLIGNRSVAVSTYHLNER